MPGSKPYLINAMEDIFSNNCCVYVSEAENRRSLYIIENMLIFKDLKGQTGYVRYN